MLHQLENILCNLRKDNPPINVINVIQDYLKQIDQLYNVKKKEEKEIVISTSDILQNAINKGKIAHDKALKDEKEALEQFQEKFIQAFKKSAFNKDYKFTTELFLTGDITSSNAEKYLIENIDFLSKCIINVSMTKNYFREITVTYKADEEEY